VPEPLALFPLNVVIVPGLVLPLHIFEPRYRAMVRDLLHKADPASREFGIATVREGRSFDSQGISALYPVGTATVLREVTELPDGRFDILTTGTRRFRLVDVDRSADLAMASVEFLEEATEPGDELIAAQTALAFDRYRQLLGGRMDADETAGVDQQDLPEDPTVLSYLVTAAMVLPWAERQDLLAAPDTATRLRFAIELLQRENRIITALHAVPAVDSFADLGCLN